MIEKDKIKNNYKIIITLAQFFFAFLGLGFIFSFINTNTLNIISRCTGILVVIFLTVTSFYNISFLKNLRYKNIWKLVAFSALTMVTMYLLYLFGFEIKEQHLSELGFDMATVSQGISIFILAWIIKKQNK